MINVNLIEKIINRKFYNLNKREKKLARNILIKLYWKYDLSFREIAFLFKKDYDTIQQWFKRLNIKKRTHKEAILLKKEKMNVKNIPGEIKTQIIIYRKKQKKKTILSRNLILNKLSKNIEIDVNTLYSYFFIRKINRQFISSEKIPKNLLKSLYTKYKLSLKEIGSLFGLGASKIRKRMQKYNIPRRTLSEALTKYPKRPFKIRTKEDLKFKSYLIGARCGDLYASSEEKRIICNVSSTHPAWEPLMKELFENYGYIKSYPFENRADQYAWNITAYLHETFDFLKAQLKFIPEWINKDKLLFISFLAGLVDTDGFITLNGKRPRLGISITNKSLLNSIKIILKIIDYHPTLTFKKNDESHFGEKRMWLLNLSRVHEVLSLIKILPLKHKEKANKKELILKYNGKELVRLWKILAENIAKESKEYQYLAKTLVTKRI